MGYPRLEYRHIPIGEAVAGVQIIILGEIKGCDGEFQVSSFNSLFSYIVGSLNFLYKECGT
jgi:hypothetical protein